MCWSVPTLSDRLPGNRGSELPDCQQKTVTQFGGGRLVKEESLHAEIGAVCRASYARGRDARDRGGNSNVRYPTEGWCWEPVYSAG